jgi:hypothetical protein
LLQKVRLGAVDMDASSLNYLIKYEKEFAVVVPLFIRQLRARAPGARWPAHEVARSAGREAGLCHFVQLGIGIPQPDQQFGAIVLVDFFINRTYANYY